MNDIMTFDNLIGSVKNIHGITSTYAKGAVNQLLTIRNWMIGYYIVEYEQQGKDRAEYGTNLLGEMARVIDVKGLDRSHLNLCRLFYARYPQICATVSHKLESIKGTWSVRELRRQIDTKLFIRAGISKNPDLLLDKIESGDINAVLPIKDIFAFEFLGLDAKDLVEESDLEKAIMDNLQTFLLEMGKGFCFEARQKRILIDDEYYFPDLVLYNRILHCNVIIELKVDKFDFSYAAQLNAYVSYYKDCEMTEGDNPPIGILLCTQKGPKMVEYVLNGMDENLFVSTYMLQLPDKKQLEEFLVREMKELGI